MVAATSMQAYRELVNSGKDGIERAVILEYMLGHPEGKTRREIAKGINEEMGVEIDYTNVCARVNFLVSHNALKVEGQKLSEKKKPCGIVKPILSSDS